MSTMLDHLRTHGLISKQQHCFLSKWSTATNLIESLNDWTINFENGSHQTVAYVDFAKAFDTVCHNKLIIKLRPYGIKGELLEWIKDFLAGRSHRTVVGHSLSDVAYISTGVVQDSCSCLLYINDLAGLFPDKVTIKLYADDVKLYSNIITNAFNATYDLQDQLEELSKWATVWPVSYTHLTLPTILRV